MPQFLQIHASKAANAFDRSGREAHTANVQRMLREMARGTACDLFARPAFAKSGVDAILALRGHLDFSPTTLMLYVGGDLTHVISRLNRMAAESAANVERLARLFETLADAGESQAEQVLDDKSAEEERARNLMVLAALAAGAQIAVQELMMLTTARAA